MKNHMLHKLGLILTVVVLSMSGCGATKDSTSKSDLTTDQSTSQNNTTPSEKAQYKRIDAKEAYTMLQADTPPILVDVRTEEEFEEKHIQGALLIPNESIVEEPPALLPDKDATILIYCRSGNRSEQAARKLLDMGYQNVIDFGGINDWPYDTVTGWTEEATTPKGEEEVSLSNFTTTDIKGNEVTEDIFSNADLTMINIWATFCSPCLTEMPELAEISQEYKDKGLQVIGIVADANNGNVEVPEDMLTLIDEIIAKTNANYTHLLPSKDLVLAKLNEVQVVPETIFVDSKGNLVGESYKGAKSKDEWLTIIDKTLPLVQS